VLRWRRGVVLVVVLAGASCSSSTRTVDAAVEDDSIHDMFELLDDGKARLGDLILCGGETTYSMECGA
jgi:hypothetical protein